MKILRIVINWCKLFVPHWLTTEKKEVNKIFNDFNDRDLREFHDHTFHDDCGDR
jgi:hypothetical protein